MFPVFEGEKLNMPTSDLPFPEDVGTIQTSPRVPVLDGRHLNWLIEQYLLRCRLELTDQRTVDCYASKLRWFVDWWEREGPSQKWLLRQGDFVQFEKYLRDAVSKRTKRKLAYNSRKDVFRRLGEALRWAQTHNYVSRDYTKWLPKPQGAVTKRKAAPVEALRQLLERASSSYMAARDRAMLAIFIGMGLRRGEVANLDIEDMVFMADHSGYARVLGKKTKAREDGIRDAAFDAATGSIVISYLDATGVTFGPLFRGRQNERLTPQGVYKVVKRIIRDAGLEEQIQGCHDLRRAFATHFSRHSKGENAANLLRQQLGHSHFSTTANFYVLNDVEDIRVDLISPLTLMQSKPKS